MKKTIFVIMPFIETPTRNQGDLNSFFETNIKSPIEKIKVGVTEFKVRRSDDTFDITKQIIKDLYSADYVICDLSGRQANPNVMYELGLKLAISNNPVILIREENNENQRIFDINTFYTFHYSPLRYKELEKYLIEKIVKLEKGEEKFVSPVLEILEKEPSVVSRILKIENINKLANAKSTVQAWRRRLAALVLMYAKSCSMEIEFSDDVNLLNNDLFKNEKELSKLNWTESRIVFRSSPTFDILITQPPTIEIFPHQELSIFKTFLIEFYNAFFVSDWEWRELNWDTIKVFATETLVLEDTINIIIGFLNDALEVPRDKILKDFHYVMSQSHFLTFFYSRKSWQNYEK
ncbi:MAG: hypothetical protein RIG68_07050 [Imperialibacter sp.]|uniref:hypothetical protein n=1 Tax=Imperialibacter sp. TaxID=2038411 RepID=UPI0032ECACBE